MEFKSDCIHCVINHHWSLVKDCPDEARKCTFMRKALSIVSTCDPTMAAPVVTAQLQDLFSSMFPEEDYFPELKRKYNALLLSYVPSLECRLKKADDPIHLAVWMAMAGNYIDFGMLKEIDDEHLVQMLETPDNDAVNSAELANLKGDLAQAKRLTYLTDNCGEIVLDRLLMETIRNTYPQVEITALVRGLPVFNDATEEDARFVGIDRFAHILGNGSNIGGTQLEFLSAEARAAVIGADVIVSKGQGNFETFTGTGFNTYYLLLAKCQHYTRWFGMEHMKGQLINERRFMVDNARP